MTRASALSIPARMNKILNAKMQTPLPRFYDLPRPCSSQRIGCVFSMDSVSQQLVGAWIAGA